MAKIEEEVESAPAPEKKQPKASEAKKVTKKTESAAEIDTVQEKKTLPVKKKPAPVKPGKGRKVKKVKKAPSRDLGIDIEPPVKSCDDPNCPYHGQLSLRGIILDVQVVSDKMNHTMVVKRERRHYIKKYQRYEKRTSRYLAHCPPCIEVEVGSMVKIMECRPLSKGTNFVILGRI
jgi:small subunit ribosomal protein S17